LAAAFSGGQHPLSPKRFRPPTKVVYVTKQRFPIHGILSSLASLPETNWGEYLFSYRNVIPNSGCQREICQEVMTREGDYFVVVKENQPTLRAAIAEEFRPGFSPRRRAAATALGG
jgi:hypothetical protein